MIAVGSMIIAFITSKYIPFQTTQNCKVSTNVCLTLKTMDLNSTKMNLSDVNTAILRRNICISVWIKGRINWSPCTKSMFVS